MAKLDTERGQHPDETQGRYGAFDLVVHLEYKARGLPR